MNVLPCPFCGGMSQVEVGHTYWVICWNEQCGAEGPPRPTEESAIEAWNAAPRVGMLPTQPPNTVKVRVAVGVNTIGQWKAFGGSGYTDAESIGETNPEPGDRLSWITAYAPLPEPPAEIGGEVSDG